MRRDEPAAVQPDVELPARDVPSAEVLDELLQAFAADTADPHALQQIDLTSPEVEQLLTPDHAEPGPRPAPEPAASGPGPKPDVDSEGEQEVEVEAAVEVSPAAAPEVEVDVVGADETETTPGNDAAAATTRTIRIDASDDPPDAVYLAAGDPLLAKSAGARALVAETTSNGSDARTGTVFIDDQATGGGETITLAEATTATHIEPRMRERRIAVKRAVGRKRLRWVLLATVVLAVVVAALAVLGSSLFEVDHVRVDGAVYTDPAALQAVVDDLEGTPVLRADTERAERELEAIPWVEDARVTTRFPHSATIELRERTAAATFQGPDGRYRVIDNHGRVLDVVDGQPVDYLLLVAADATDLDAGQFAPQGYAAAGGLAHALTPEIRALAESAAVTADGTDLRLMLSDGVEVRFGPARDLVTKLVRVQTRLEQLAGGGYRYLDVSTNEVTTG